MESAIMNDSALHEVTEPRRLNRIAVDRVTLDFICDWLTCQFLNTPSACSPGVLNFISSVRDYGLWEALISAERNGWEYRAPLKQIITKLTFMLDSNMTLKHNGQYEPTNR